MTQEFRGSYTVAVTPFTPDGGGIDVPRLKDFIDWQLDNDVPGLIMLGTTGEFLTLTPEERRTVVGTTVDHVAGRIPVIVGTMNASTPIAVQQSLEAQEQGAAGLMILPPYYYTPTEDEIVRYYTAISEAVDVPIMLYNNPKTSNVDMSAELVAKLATTLPNVSYIKESSNDIARVRDILDLCEGDMHVYAGERVVDSFLLGATGYVNPYGNYLPKASAGIWRLLEAGRIDEARVVQRLIDRVDRIIAAGHPTYGHQAYSKELAARMGYPVGTVRPPLTTFAQLGEEGERRVAAILEIFGELDDYVAQIGL